MECELSDCHKFKLLSALKELLKADFNVSDDTILDKLFSHIDSSKSLTDTLYLPEIGEWLEIVLSKYTDKEICYGVCIFAVRMTGLVGSTIKGFHMLQSKDILDHLLRLIVNPDIKNDSCLMVPLLDDLGKFTNHEDGWKWVTETLIWKHAIEVLNEDKSIYVKRAGISLTSLLLTKSVMYDRNVGFQVLLKICEPLIRNDFLNVQKLTENSTPMVIDTCEYDSVTDLPNILRCAKCLCSILEGAVSQSEAFPAKLCLQFQNNSIKKGCTRMTNLLGSCSSNETYQTLSMLVVMVHVSNALGKYDDINKFDSCPLNLFHCDMYWIIESMTSYGHFNALMNICVACLSWQFKLNNNKKICKNTCHNCFGFECSIVNCLIAFLRMHSNCFMGTERRPYEENMKLEIHCIQPSRNSTYCEGIYKKLLIECRSNIEKSTRMSFQYIQLGVFGLSRSLNYITCLKSKQDIFRFVLNTIDNMVKLLSQSEGLVIPILLNLLALASKIIEDHLIPFWTLNYSPSKNIVMTIINILRIDSCDTRITTTALQLLDKAVRYHIVPDLLKKADTIPDTDVRVQLFNLSLMIYKLSDPSWEVRDTALEVFQTMIDMAGLLPWLFTDIFQADMLNKILDLAINDECAYVRTSALNFLTKAVRGVFFEACIKKITLLELALKTLKNDGIPAPRSAACNLITTLYIKCDSSFKEYETEVFGAIYSVSLNDLDWEVKKAALNFWRCTIDKLLTSNMIPLQCDISSSLKFSNINKGEKSTQLSAVFEILGDVGCLKAIWLGVNDECDLKVSQEAQNIVDHLEQLDQQWKFIEDIRNHPHVGEMSDNDATSSHKLKAKDFFLLLQNQDWRERLSSRQNWIENKSDDLISLLDHILNVDNMSSDWDHNAIDCY